MSTRSAARDRRIADLKDELDEAHDLIQRQDEQLQDIEALLENWKRAFDMTLGNDGCKFGAWVQQRDKQHDDYVSLIREWNKNVTLFNNTVIQRNVGRPLAASEAPINTVRQLHRRGMSLRGIAEDSSLGLPTVRAIVNQQDGTDRRAL